jgi:urease accessory protein
MSFPNLWPAATRASGSPSRHALLLPLIPTSLLLLAPAAQAHHLMDLLHLQPTPFTGLLSGLAHPVLGPDHLVFLLALSLVGLGHRSAWMLALLLIGLAGSLLGLVVPGLPGTEALVSATLLLEALVLLAQWPVALLLPAFGLHGYALSSAVLGWTQGPLVTYLVGLLLGEGLLLLLALTVLRRLAAPGGEGLRRLLAGVLIGCGAAWTWSALVP